MQAVFFSRCPCSESTIFIFAMLKILLSCPESSQGKRFLATGLSSLRNPGAPVCLGSYQKQNMLWVSVFEVKEGRYWEQRWVCPFLTNLTLCLFISNYHHHHPYLQWLPKSLVHSPPNCLHIPPPCNTLKLLRIERTHCLPILIIICPKRSFKRLIKTAVLQGNVWVMPFIPHAQAGLCVSLRNDADWSHKEISHRDIFCH